MAEDIKAVRDSLRERLFASRKLKTKLITIRDVEVEIHQPTIGDVLKMKDNANQQEGLMQILLSYCFVPNTNTKVFESGDMDVIMGWGVEDWFAKVAEAVQELTGVTVEQAEKN